MLTPAQRQAAIEHLTAFTGVDMAGITDAAIQTAIEEWYLGGWSKFLRDNPATTSVPVVAVQPTWYKQLSKIYDETGHKIHLGMFEEVQAVSMSDTSIMVMISCAEVSERYTEDRITRSGTRLITFQFNEDCGCPDYAKEEAAEDESQCCAYAEGWWHIETVESWTESDITFKRGPLLSPGEAKARRDWEGLCYRPGNSRTPLDNADRTFQGTVESTVGRNKKMERHWKI